MRLELDPSERTVRTTTLVLPDDQRAWVMDTIRGDGVELVSDTVDRTRTGWPLRIVVVRALGDWRVHAFYAFFEHAAVASWITGITGEAEVAQCIELARTGRPCWTDGVAALVELWDGAFPI